MAASLSCQANPDVITQFHLKIFTFSRLVCQFAAPQKSEFISLLFQENMKARTLIKIQLIIFLINQQLVKLIMVQLTNGKQSG
jgi:hypothetical protein